MKRHVYFYCILIVSIATCSTAITIQATHQNKKTCAICSDPLKDPVRLECGHQFNRACINKWVKKRKACPTCRTKTNYPGDTKAARSRR